MLVSFSGTLVQIENLSFWWVERENTEALKTVQPGSFACFMDSLFSQKAQPKNKNSSFKMSVDVYRLLISMNGMVLSHIFDILQRFATCSRAILLLMMSCFIKTQIVSNLK